MVLQLGSTSGESAMSGRDWRFAFLGMGGLAVVAVGVVAIVAWLGIYDVAADTQHSSIADRFVAYVRERSIDTRAGRVRVPALNRPDMIADGASDYDEMCTGCHLAPGLSENEMRPGLKPKPPLLARGTPGDAAEEFWIVKHGIDMTAMPAWGRTHSDAEMWNIVAFLQILRKLSPQQYRALVAKAADHHHHEMGGMDDHMKM
jgi:mono/diheme cytochrome c family protein